MLGPAEVLRRCSPARAADAVEQALRDGLDPAGDIPRTAVPFDHGHLLLMPSGAHEGFRAPGLAHVGIKVAAVVPGNLAVDLPRVQASYLLLDAWTLSLLAVLDGTALTTLRTPAVSVAAVRRHLLRRDGPLSVVVIGSGPQALGHVAALQESVGPHRSLTVTFLVRDPERTRDRLPVGQSVAGLASPEAERLLGGAGLVVCATSARDPLFDSSLLASDAVVVAVGSHEPDAREVDTALCRRASVVVEDRAAALREAGDIVLAVAETALHPDGLMPMRDVVIGTTDLPLDRPLLFKSVGMSWEDLVVAAAVLAGHS